MKKKVIICIYILLSLIFLKQAFNYFYNESVIRKYNNGNYSTDVSALYFLNCFQPYIAHYNNGNIYYQEGNYDKAIEEYYKALELNPPKYKECSIRINIALAMLERLGDDYAKPERVEETIEELNAAIDVLLEDGCATEEDDGHSETAEQLKEEIEDLIEKLQEQSESEPQPDDNNQSQPEQQDEQDSYENNVMEQLQEIQSEAYLEREEGMQSLEEYDMDYNFDYDGSIW